MVLINVFVAERNIIFSEELQPLSSTSVAGLCTKLRQSCPNSAISLYVAPEGKVPFPINLRNPQDEIRVALAPLTPDWKSAYPNRKLNTVLKSPVNEDTIHFIAAGVDIPTVHILDKTSGKIHRLRNVGRADIIENVIPLASRDLPGIKVYKPMIPVFVEDGLMIEPIPSLAQLQAVPATRQVENYYPWEASVSLLYFIFEVDANAIEEEAAEEEDVVSMFIKDFKGTVANALRGPSPSVAAKSNDYGKIQGSPHPLYDGRISENGGATIAPPIELYHPIFDRFRRLLQDPDLSVPDDFVQKTARLIRHLSIIVTKEVIRDRDVNTLFGELLGVPLVRIKNADMSSPDSVCLHTTKGKTAVALSVNELKPELGSGGSEPSVQASFSYQRFWSQDEQKDIRNKCCCPSFLIAVAGPWIVICGAVFTRHIVVQHLTPYSRFGFGHALDDKRQLGLTRMLYALSLSLDDLRTYYNNILPTTPTEVELLAGQLSPRFLPFVSSYVDRTTGTQIHFDLIAPLENVADSVTFKAKRQDGNMLVVKFVTQYGGDPHALLAKNNAAPELHYFGPVSNDMDSSHLKMVVMDYVSGKTLYELFSDQPLPENIKERIREILDLLANAGFVFPDLRRPNVMLLDDETLPLAARIWLIDLDWAGKLGKVRFPLHLSQVIRETAQVADHIKVTREHERRMFDAL